MLKIENLSFSFKDNIILSDISAHCDNNQFISFIGPSGSGKTTLLNLIAGIYKPQYGNIINPFNKISYVFQQDSLLPWLTVLQNILLPVEIYNKKINFEDKQKAINLLAELGLEDIENLFPSELSGGMKKRVELARALIIEPELLILDEPFSSLDVLTRERLNVILKNICKIRKLAVILVTHSIEEACFLSDRIYVLSDKPAKVIEIFDNKLDENPAKYFILSNNESETEQKIRSKVFNEWNFKGDEKNKDINNKNLHRNKMKISKIDNNNKITNTDNLIKSNNSSEDRKKHYKKFDIFNPKNNKTNLKDENKKDNLLFNFLVPIEIFIILLFLQLLKKSKDIPDFFFPLPSSLFLRFISTIKEGIIFKHLFQTMIESFSGFIIAFFLSIILGYLLSRSKVIYKLIMPYLIAFNAIPSIALVPFLILWFGFSIIPKIIIAIIVIFFPMLVNNITAFNQIQNQYKNLLLFYKPDFKERFLRFELPGSLLYIFAAVKVSITLSVIGAVVGEFQAGSVGLGSLILIAKANFDTELMFVGLIWLVLLGLTYFWIATFIYNSITKRKKTADINK